MGAPVKMRCAAALLALVAMAAQNLRAGTVLTAEGALLEGNLGIDHGIVVRGPAAPVKVPFQNILRARFAAFFERPDEAHHRERRQ